MASFSEVFRVALVATHFHFQYPQAFFQRSFPSSGGIFVEGKISGEADQGIFNGRPEEFLDCDLGLFNGQALELHSAVERTEGHLATGLYLEDALDRQVGQGVDGMDEEEIPRSDNIRFHRWFFRLFAVLKGKGCDW